MKLLRFTLKFILCVVCIFQLSQDLKSQSTFDLTKPLLKCREIALTEMSDYQIASDNNVYFFFKDGLIRQINTNNGKENWISDFGGSFKENFRIIEKKIFILVSDKKNNITKLRAINADNGIVEWESPLTVKSVHTFTSNNRFIIITDSEQQVTAFDISLRKEIWKLRLSEELNIKPFIFEDRLILSLKNSLLQISLVNGKYLKKFPIKYKISTILYFDRLLFLGTEKGMIYSLDAETGRKNWEYQLGGKVSLITRTKKGILFASYDNFIYLFDENGSQILWKSRMVTRNVIGPIVFEELVVIANFGVNIMDILDLNSGRLVNRVLIEPNNQFLDKPVFSNGFLLVPTLRGIFLFGSNSCETKKQI